MQDVDKAFRRAVEGGAKALMPPTDMFWGDRFGQVEDPSGHRWGLATHKEDPSPEEMARRQKEFFAQMGHQKQVTREREATMAKKKKATKRTPARGKAKTSARPRRRRSRRCRPAITRRRRTSP